MVGPGMGNFNYWYPIIFCREIYTLPLLTDYPSDGNCDSVPLGVGAAPMDSWAPLWPSPLASLLPSLALLPFSLILYAKLATSPLVLRLLSKVISDSNLPDGFQGNLPTFFKASLHPRKGTGGGSHGQLPWRPLPLPAKPRLLQLSGHV